VIGRDDSVECSAHRFHENRISRKGALDSCLASGRGKNLIILFPETSAIACVRVKRAERDSRLVDSKPLREVLARDGRGVEDCLFGDGIRHIAQRQVSRRKHDSQRIRRALAATANRRQHHCDLGVSELGQHFRVTGKIISAGEQC